MAEVDVSAELDRMFEDFDGVMQLLGESFTWEDFRQRMTQRNQKAYIDLLWRCREYENPFGQAHWFIAHELRRRLAAAGYRRQDQGRSGGERNIFGGATDKIVYWRSGVAQPRLRPRRRNQKQPGAMAQRLLFDATGTDELT